MFGSFDYTSVVTVIVSIIGALTSAQAWNFWLKKQNDKKEKEQALIMEKDNQRDDLRNEVQTLKKEIKELYIKREQELKEMQNKIIDLTQQLSAFKIRVEFLEKENSRLQEALDQS